MDYQASECGDESESSLEMRLFVVVCRVVGRAPGMVEMPKLPGSRSGKKRRKHEDGIIVGTPNWSGRIV